MHTDSEKIVNIPESVRYYLANIARIQSIEKADTPPPSFKFNEVQDFFKVKNNLAICKIELFQFMCEVFEKVWMTAIADKKFEALTWGEQCVEKDVVGNVYSPDIIWSDGYIYWYFRKETQKLCAGCSYTVNDKKEYTLDIELYFHNGKDWVEFDDLHGKLGDHWQAAQDYPTAYCLKNSVDCPTLQGTTVDVSFLAKRAKEALDVLDTIPAT